MKKGDYLKEENIMNSEKKCAGCGVLLQDQNVLQESGGADAADGLEQLGLLRSFRDRRRASG